MFFLRKVVFVMLCCFPVLFSSRSRSKHSRVFTFASRMMHLMERLKGARKLLRRKIVRGFGGSSKHRGGLAKQH